MENCEIRLRRMITVRIIVLLPKTNHFPNLLHSRLLQGNLQSRIRLHRTSLRSSLQGRILQLSNLKTFLHQLTRTHQDKISLRGNLLTRTTHQPNSQRTTFYQLTRTLQLNNPTEQTFHNSSEPSCLAAASPEFTYTPRSSGSATKKHPRQRTRALPTKIY